MAIVLYGLSWQNIDLIGLALPFLAVIDPNSFRMELVSRIELPQKAVLIKFYSFLMIWNLPIKCVH